MKGKTMKGIGIDLCGVERVRDIIDGNARFLERYFTPEEREYLEKRGVARYDSAAAMFAAKEAFLKAVGTGLTGGIVLNEISVSHLESGSPFLTLTGKAEEVFTKLGCVSAFLSLTHENGMACAVCVLE